MITVKKAKREKIITLIRELRLNTNYLTRQVQDLGMDTSSSSIQPLFLIIIIIHIKFLSRSTNTILNSVSAQGQARPGTVSGRQLYVASFIMRIQM